MNYKFIQQDNSLTVAEDSPHFNATATRFFNHLASVSPFYKKQIEQTGISTETPVELLSKMPITTKQHYRDVLQHEALQALQAGPFISDYSSGSTDKCVLRFSSAPEELAELEITEQVFRRAGMGADDRFACLEVGAPEIYDFYFRAARNVGATQTTYIKVTNDYKASFNPLLRLNPTVILTLPSLIVKAWPYVKDFWPHGESPIRSFIHMGEAMHPELKREIEAVWGCKVYSFYGTTELGGMGGECSCSSGCHFDPSLICPTLENYHEIEPGIFEGEGFFSTFHFRNQSVVKYRVGDIVRLDINPCPCGETTPRLRFIERTSDSFIITGDKFRYDTIFDALKSALPEMTLLTIRISDIPDSDQTQLTFILPHAMAAQKKEILQIVQFGIFELDSVYHYGFAEFELQFVAPEKFGDRKMQRVVDERRFFS